MSVTADANLLLYASDDSSPWHDPAREVLDQLSRGPDLLYLFWPVLMSYLRISTHPRVFQAPLTPEEAMGNVEELLTLRHVRTPGEGEDFWSSYRAVARAAVVRGNLVPDAHLVALMRGYGVTVIWSHDRDFRKFDGIRPRDPFAAPS